MHQVSLLVVLANHPVQVVHTPKDKGKGCVGVAPQSYACGVIAARSRWGRSARALGVPKAKPKTSPVPTKVVAAA